MKNAKEINIELLEKYIFLKNEGATSDLNILELKENKSNKFRNKSSQNKLNENLYKKVKH